MYPLYTKLAGSPNSVHEGGEEISLIPSPKMKPWLFSPQSVTELSSYMLLYIGSFPPSENHPLKVTRELLVAEIKGRFDLQSKLGDVTNSAK